MLLERTPSGGSAHPGLPRTPAPACPPCGGSVAAAPLGSSAVIMRRRLEDVLAGHTTRERFAPRVWDGWNAKTTRPKADDALAVDEAVLEAPEAVSA